MNEKPPQEFSEETRHLAIYVAMVVRNTMEDFHCQHLSDEQMRELNPIIRNAIGTALHAFQHHENSEVDQMFVAFPFIDDQSRNIGKSLSLLTTILRYGSK